MSVESEARCDTGAEAVGVPKRARSTLVVAPRHLAPTACRLYPALVVAYRRLWRRWRSCSRFEALDEIASARLAKLACIRDDLRVRERVNVDPGGVGVASLYAAHKRRFCGRAYARNREICCREIVGERLSGKHELREAIISYDRHRRRRRRRLAPLCSAAADRLNCRSALLTATRRCRTQKRLHFALLAHSSRRAGPQRAFCVEDFDVTREPLKRLHVKREDDNTRAKKPVVIFSPVINQSISIQCCALALRQSNLRLAYHSCAEDEARTLFFEAVEAQTHSIGRRFGELNAPKLWYGF